jgi:tetratricopeptide (TPR) repeat protein
MTTEQYYQKGLNYLQTGNYQQALLSFDKALAHDGYNATIISDKAIALFHLGDKQNALALLDQAQNIEPNNPYRYASRAFVKDAMGDLHGAIADYKKAIELDPEDMIAYNNLGLLEEKLGYKQSSQNNFKKADELVEKYGHIFGLEATNEDLTDKEIPAMNSKPTDNQQTSQFSSKASETPTLPKEQLSLKYFIQITKQVFSSKEFFQEFVSFVARKKK